MGLFTVVGAVRAVTHIKHESNIMAIGFSLTAVSSLSLNILLSGKKISGGYIWSDEGIPQKTRIAPSCEAMFCRNTL